MCTACMAAMASSMPIHDDEDEVERLLARIDDQEMLASRDVRGIESRDARMSRETLERVANLYLHNFSQKDVELNWRHAHIIERDNPLYRKQEADDLADWRALTGKSGTPDSSDPDEANRGPSLSAALAQEWTAEHERRMWHAEHSRDYPFQNLEKFHRHREEKVLHALTALTSRGGHTDTR